MADPALTSYDVLPYQSDHFPLSHPERLATVATVFGMKPQPVERCRVLELGSASGGNLVPMALDLPDSRFVGIDLSARQIADGLATIAGLGLHNVQLKHMSILDIEASLRRFDYIIAHGVYSWVPPDVQDRILAICRGHLAANGVAYISYNIYPGWCMQGQVRDTLCYHTRHIADPTARVRAAREFLELLGRIVPREGSAYGFLIRQVLEHFRKHDDAYLFHDFLEDVNEPVYFHEMIDRTSAHGLQYLGEARIQSMSAAGLAPEADELLKKLGADLLQYEQYLDLFGNRQFRHSLFCHKEVALDRTRNPACMDSLHVASSVKPVTADADLHSSAILQFRSSAGALSTSHPLLKSALLCLGDAWPRSVPFVQLCSLAHSRLHPGLPRDTVAELQGRQLLASSFLNAHLDTGIVELHTHAGQCMASVSDHPRADGSARFRASSNSRVANVFHQHFELEQVDRHLLRYLDGSRDRDALLTVMMGLRDQGLLVIQENDRPIQDTARVRGIVSDLIDSTLRRLARDGFLVG